MAEQHGILSPTMFGIDSVGRCPPEISRPPSHRKTQGKGGGGKPPPLSPMERLDPDNYGFPARPNHGNY